MINHSIIPKDCWQDLRACRGQSFWVLSDGYTLRLLIGRDRRVSVGNTHSHSAQWALAVRHAGSLEAVGENGRLIGEFASSGGVHGPSVSGAALGRLAKPSPHGYNDCSQDYSQAEGYTEHHHHVTTEGSHSDRCGG